MKQRTLAVLGAALIAVLALPAIAAAHVSVHPNTVPAGAFATLNLRVPGEEENAFAYKVAMQVPSGFISLDTENVPGWSVETKTRKLAKPIETDDGHVFDVGIDETGRHLHRHLPGVGAFFLARDADVEGRERPRRDGVGMDADVGRGRCR